jgi:hypothetical protein
MVSLPSFGAAPHDPLPSQYAGPLQFEASSSAH